MARLDRTRFSRTGRVIAVADVVESVRLMEEDTASFIQRWQAFLAYVVQRLPGDGGRMHRSLGDGLMLEFPDAVTCMGAVLPMQAWFGDGNRLLPPEQHMHLRIGAHLADFVEDQYDIYGPDVNLTARIASLAGPGEIVISAALRKELRTWKEATITDLGSCHLKHVKEPVHAFRIGSAGSAPVMPVQMPLAPSLRPRVAVLRFAVETDPEHRSSGDTLVDDIVAALACSDTLQVVSRLGTTPLHVAPAAPDNMQQQVGASYVLTGRARAISGALALYAELTDALNGHVVWANNFEGMSPHRAGLDERLLARLVAAVHEAVIRHEVERSHDRPLPALDAATLLLASLGLMHRLSPVDMEHARGMLEHLAERWRRHASAHAWLSHLHVLRVQQAGAAFTAHDGALARAHAAAAVQCDPASALVLAFDGHAALHTARNQQAAADRYAQALRVRGDHSLALLFHAELLALQDAGAKARVLAERGLRNLSLEPLRYLYEAVCAMVMLAADDIEAAHQLAQQSVQRNPRYFAAWRTLVVAQVESDRLAEARVSQQRMMRKQPAFSVASFLAGTPMEDELARRYCEAMLQAGVPAT